MKTKATSAHVDVPCVEEIIRHHSRSFSMASRCLPSGVRQDVEKLYAWCRICDDSVDVATRREEAQSQIQQMRCDLDIIAGGGAPQHPASRLIGDLMTTRGIQQQDAEALLTGMQMDLNHVPMQSEQQLMSYCYHVAGVVGLMMCRILGVTDRAAGAHAISLGIAMQLTNIARDVREDAERGRCYLLGVANPGLASPAELVGAVKQVLLLADKRHEHAMQGLRFLPGRCRFAIIMAAPLYHEIGQQIRRQRYDVWSGRIVVPKWRLVLVVVASAFRWWTLLLSHASQPAIFRLSFSNEQEFSMKEALHTAYLGVSLTAFMAAGLFMIVYADPKDESYAWLPLAYSAISVFVGFAANWMARRQERGMQVIPVRVDQ